MSFNIFYWILILLHSAWANLAGIISSLQISSMKYTKSSYSLHCDSTNILTPQSTNQPFGSNWRIQLKKPFFFKKQSENIYNVRGRLNSLRQQIQQIQQQNKSVDFLNKQLRLNIGYLKEQYLDHGLKNVELKLDTIIKELKKKVTIRTRSDLLVYGSIQQILESQYKNHQQLKGKLRQVEERVELLQNIMGVNLDIPQPQVENQQNQYYSST